MSEDIKIEPIQVKQYEVKQSKYKQCGTLPVRNIILGPSGSGKTILLQNLILKVYRGCFERIYIFSPSINVDSTWDPVKEYMEDEMDIHENTEEQFYFDSYNPEALENIIATQNKVIKHMKAKKKKKLFQVLIIVDDFADDPTFSRHSKLLHSLYTRGRHAMISTITATQKFSSISPIIRVNSTELYVYRLRNQNDLDKFLEEVSAVLDKKTLLKVYQETTKEPYSFLYVKLTAKTIEDMFYSNFNKKVTFAKEVEPQNEFQTK